MTFAKAFRAGALALFTGAAAVIATLPVSIFAAALTPAVAQVSDEFAAALEGYGSWERHPRWGEVWVPQDRPRDWQPYSYGYWANTEDWGWYWVSDQEEEDWGWITYHYGRWAFEQRLGWFWIPGDEWAPAWVDWRYGDDAIGWAPLPPDELIDEYEAQPAYWVFIPPRYLGGPRLRTYMYSSQRRAGALRGSHVVNRTVGISGRRLAVNPGISAAFIASITHQPMSTFRVRPRVLAGTQGVSGAVQVRKEDLHGKRQGGQAGGARTRTNVVTVERTTTVVRASAAAKPEPLGKGERGRLGSQPPRAAQGAGAATPQAPAPAATTPVSPSASPSRTQAPPPAATTPANQPRTQQQEQKKDQKDERRDQRPARAAPAKPNELSPAKPERPLQTQTPPPPKSNVESPRQPAVNRPAPPARPVTPAAKPVEPKTTAEPKKEPPRKPGEKPGDKPQETK